MILLLTNNATAGLKLLLIKFPALSLFCRLPVSPSPRLVVHWWVISASLTSLPYSYPLGSPLEYGERSANGKGVAEQPSNFPTVNSNENHFLRYSSIRTA